MKRGIRYAAFGLLAVAALSLVLARCACSEATCGTNADCATGEVCVSKSCVKGSIFDGSIPPYDPLQVGCNSDDQCGPCETCSSGLCTKMGSCDTGDVTWPDGSAGDAGLVDAGDAGPVDAGDAGPVDAGDAGPVDAGDAGPIDAGDAGPVDTGDAGPVDTGTGDAGDAGTGDGGSCDAGTLPALVIGAMSPATGKLPRGKIVTFTGQGFDPSCNTNEVYFTGDPTPAQVTSVSGTQLKVRIPRNANTGLITIRAAGRQDTSQMVNIVRRLFLTREGAAASPGQTFSLINVETMQAFASGTYNVGQGGQPVGMPTAVALNPKQWKIYFITSDPANEAHLITIHDYADLTYVSTVAAAAGAGAGYAALFDEENSRLLVTHPSGKLTVLDTTSDVPVAGSPFTVGATATGIELDTKNGVYYVAGKTAITGNGQVAIVKRSDLTVASAKDLGAGVAPSDVKYDVENDLVLVADISSGNVHVFNAGTLGNLPASPIAIEAGAAPMSITIGGTGSSRLAFIACSYNKDHKQQSPHAKVASYSLPLFAVQPSSPQDVSIITTSEDQLGDFDQVRAVYDRRDNFIIVTSDDDKNYGVLNPDLTKVTAGTYTSPFLSPSSKGNLGIAVEDW